MKAHRFLLVLALLAVALLPVSNAVAAERAAISLSANVERLAVRPCLIETVRVGVTNNGSRGRYVDVYVTAEGPLRSSKPNFTTWVPAGGTAYANIQVTAPSDATAGEYEVRFSSAGSEDLVLPTTLENPPEAPCVPRADQIATATSYQASTVYDPSNAIDGDLATMWHTRWSPTKDPLPQSITVDLGATYDVAELVYEPRKDSSGNGVVLAYTLYGSVDGETFSELGTGTWENDRTRKSATVDATARFVRLEVTEGSGGYASAAELVFYGQPG